MVLLVPSDADGGDDGDDDDGDGDGFPTTLPAWQGPREYHGQGSNIPFGESLTLILYYILDIRYNILYIIYYILYIMYYILRIISE